MDENYCEICGDENQPDTRPTRESLEEKRPGAVKFLMLCWKVTEDDANQMYSQMVRARDVSFDSMQYAYRWLERTR